MYIKTIDKDSKSIAVVSSNEKIITDVQSALDFIMTIHYETDCNHIALNKEAISEDFFQLSTCLAGDIMQKFINYRIKFAIFGDFTKYTSKPLKDLIYECNNGNDLFFVPDEESATEKLFHAR